MWSRRRLDIGWTDLLYGILRVCFPPDRAAMARRVERRWPMPEQTIACLSVRSGFDLLLGALSLPRGSEVLVSAITIPDMVRIVEHHGLVPVPVDIDPRQMAPTEDQWRRAITPATRLILAAHLFGGRTDLGPIVDLARQHDLLVIEDCAQAFAGTGYQGHPLADTSMFSFGTIKSNTALGGAVLCVRNRDILARMRTVQAAYPVQGRRPYLKRLAKATGLKALSNPLVYGMFVRLCRAAGCDYDKWINRAARGFPGSDFFAQIRCQPTSPLMSLLDRRLRNADPHRLERHIAKGQVLATVLQEAVFRPGASAPSNTYWAFPIVVESPGPLIRHLARNGFDATQGHSLCTVAPPADRPWLAASAAEDSLKQIVFLPFYPELPVGKSQHMAEAIRAAAHIAIRSHPTNPPMERSSSNNGQ
jgi:perosamine synthetase